jgi:hypothetical protein
MMSARLHFRFPDRLNSRRVQVDAAGKVKEAC